MNAGTYVRPRAALRGPAQLLLRIACQLAPCALLATLVACGEAPAGDGAAESRARGAAARALLEEYDGAEVAREELPVRARTIAERLRTGVDPDRMEPLEREMAACVEALALLPASEELPWREWIEDSRYVVPDLATEYLRVAHRVLGAEALALAQANDQRETPDPLRLQAHRVLWAEDPPYALARARHVLFRENPRHRDRFRPLLVEELLSAQPGPRVDELFLEIATDDGMEPRARTLAVREIEERRLADGPAILEGLFLTEAVNVLLRKEALLAILELDPERAHRILLEEIPEPGHQPVLHAFMAELRQEEGLPAP